MVGSREVQSDAPSAGRDEEQHALRRGREGPNSLLALLLRSRSVQSDERVPIPLQHTFDEVQETGHKGEDHTLKLGLVQSELVELGAECLELGAARDIVPPEDHGRLGVL